MKNLLQQRTGIPDIFGDEFVGVFFSNPTKSYTIEELLEYVYDKVPLSDVDTEYHYSDANFSLLTLVINKVEGNYISALKSRIFNPLNLETTYFIESVDQVPDHLVNTYWDLDGDGVVANTTSGEPLTIDKYNAKLEKGRQQISRGETLTTDELRKEVASWKEK